jgi:hypothetical protein
MPDTCPAEFIRLDFVTWIKLPEAGGGGGGQSEKNSQIFKFRFQNPSQNVDMQWRYIKHLRVTV